jgi:MerR HTH family regulatory protein
MALMVFFEIMNETPLE